MKRRKPARIPATRRAPAPVDRVSALHEAAHAVVAHALGHQVVYVRVIPVELPVGHPDNPYDWPMISAAFQRSEPALAAEVSAAHAAGLPLTGEQTEWLLQEAVINLAGGIAECIASGSEELRLPPGADADLVQVGQVAGMLGQLEQAPDGAEVVSRAFHREAMRASSTIVSELTATVNELANSLAASPVQERAELERGPLAGSPLGSHVAVLDPLRGLLSGARPIAWAGDGAPGRGE